MMFVLSRETKGSTRKYEQFDFICIELDYKVSLNYKSHKWYQSLPFTSVTSQQMMAYS